MTAWGVEVRYSYDFGWLSVRDPSTGEWHDIWRDDAPSGWRRRAFAEKQSRKGNVSRNLNAADVSHPPTNGRPEEAYAF